MRIGLDLGGTKTDAVVIDGDDSVLGSVRIASEPGVPGVIDTVFAALDALADQTGIAHREFRSVGIGMPGQVAPGSTVVTHALNLQVRELDVHELLASRLGIPVRVENDVKAAALGAFALEAADASSLAYLNLGTGVAAGIVVDGQVWRGRHGTAGEIGHISIDPAGPQCICGARGCIESFAGGAAIAARWGSPSELPVREVFDAADAGDQRAMEIRSGVARAIAAAVRVLVLTSDVEWVVLGGGLTALRERLLPDVLQALDASSATSEFLGSLQLSARIRLLDGNSHAAAFGAALLGGSGGAGQLR